MNTKKTFKCVEINCTSLREIDGHFYLHMPNFCNEGGRELLNETLDVQVSYKVVESWNKK